MVIVQQITDRVHQPLLYPISPSKGQNRLYSAIPTRSVHQVAMMYTPKDQLSISSLITNSLPSNA